RQGGQSEADDEEIHAGYELLFLHRTVDSRHRITNEGGYGVLRPAGVMAFGEPEADHDEREQESGKTNFLTHDTGSKIPSVFWDDVTPGREKSNKTKTSGSAFAQATAEKVRNG